MKPFLKQVVDYYYKGDIEQKVFIFPNRRSISYFRKYLIDCVGQSSLSKPIRIPETVTINDFFYEFYPNQKADRLSLLLVLYDCYKDLYKGAESLDDFIFWGDMLLSDFNDIDKYLAEPKQIFTNIKDRKNIQDDFSYLTENQRKAMEHFISHFTVLSENKNLINKTGLNVKLEFLKIWDILLPLYNQFNESLKQKQLSYEGMVYRSVVKRLKNESVLDILSKDKLYVFVGLNALNECEKYLMKTMKETGIAEFCWDYSSDIIKDKVNKSSFFMEENIKSFPSSFVLDTEGLKQANINILSVDSAIGQVKQSEFILRNIAEVRGFKEGIKDIAKQEIEGADTAFVLADENLLLPLLTSIPLDIDKLNVTMGYSITNTALYDLMANIFKLQQGIYKKKNKYVFYHKNVKLILLNSLFNSILTKEEQEQVENLKKESVAYYEEEMFAKSKLLSLIFKTRISDMLSTDKEQVDNILSYLIDILLEISPLLAGKESLAIQSEVAIFYYEYLLKLRDLHLEIRPKTLFSLILRFLSGSNLSFEGEYLRGLQIMGPLETRALDFSNLVIFSCNEGIFPRSSVASSLIPAELRKIFSLPTYEYQDSVWAYYFYRLLQRTENLWLVLDSRTTGPESCEESRYIKQLKYHFSLPMNYYVVNSEIKKQEKDIVINKSDEDLIKIKKLSFSASSLNKYINCPATFYFNMIKGINIDNKIVETLDNRTIGNVYHNIMYAIYLSSEALDLDFIINREVINQLKIAPLKTLTVDYLKTCLTKQEQIKAKIRQLIQIELNTTEIVGRNIVFEEIIFNFVIKTLERDIALLKNSQMEKFEILGLELKGDWKFKNHNFYGYIDRLDIYQNQLRIIDYKTGTVKKDDYSILPKHIDKVFEISHNNHKKIPLQLFLYDKFVENSSLYRSIGDEKVIENVIYSVPDLFVDGIYSSSQNEECNELFEKKLGELILDLEDKTKPFIVAPHEEDCIYCNLAKLL